MDYIACPACRRQLAYGLTGRECFCINRHCQRFMVDIRTGEPVEDYRFVAATMADWDPRKLNGLRLQLNSEEYMERIAAVRMLARMNRPEVVDLLVTYLQGKEFDSVKPMAAQLLCQIADVRAVPGLRSSLKHLEHLRNSGIEREYANQLIGEIESRTQFLTRKCESLLDAVKQNDVSEVQRQIKKGAAVWEKGEQGETALHWASQRGLTAIAEILVEAGSDVNLEDNLGHTPLSLAASEWHREIILLLVRNGADLQRPAPNGVGILHFAAFEGDAEIAQLLVKAGANRFAPLPDGQTPQDIARATGHREVLSVLEDCPE